MMRDAPRASQPAGNGARVDTAIEAVRRALTDIEYGSVLIKIHQGEVVGIETSTKVRLKDTPPEPR
jgi:hypothetical protein